MSFPNCRSCRVPIRARNGREGVSYQEEGDWKPAGCILQRTLVLPCLPFRLPMTSKQNIYTILSEVADPEVPAINVVELGVVRDVEFEGDQVQVVLTPTYSGCPAMKIIRDRILDALHRHGYEKASTRTVLSPAWTTDWISDDARRKLKAYGISPPGRTSEVGLLGEKTIACPLCSSEDTELRSEFGSTPCKALRYCNACCQPFEHFKCL